RDSKSGRSTIRSFQGVEVGALRAGIVDVQQKRRAKLLLDVEIADLHVAEPVIRIHGVTVGNGSRHRLREAILQGELAGRSLNVSLSDRERRLKRKLLHN